MYESDLGGGRIVVRMNQTKVVMEKEGVVAGNTVIQILTAKETG